MHDKRVTQQSEDPKSFHTTTYYSTMILFTFSPEYYVRSQRNQLFSCEHMKRMPTHNLYNPQDLPHTLSLEIRGMSQD